MARTHISKHSNTFKTQSDSDVGEGDLLRRLKGAPLSVLVALGMHGAQGRGELAKHTGWSRDAVMGALTQLVEIGLVQRLHYRCWMLHPDVHLPGFLGPAGEAKRRPDRLSDERRRNHLSVEGRPDHLSAAEIRPGSLSATESRKNGVSEPLHDHDDVQDVHNHVSHEPETDIKQIMDGLSALEPPFENAGRWLGQVSPGLVGAWLAHLNEMDRESRAHIRNEAAFVRSKVTRGEQPPAPLSSRRPPCASCGRDFFDRNGGCLVCAGVVRV